jgi:hypothetical protein
MTARNPQDRGTPAVERPNIISNQTTTQGSIGPICDRDRRNGDGLSCLVDHPYLRIRRTSRFVVKDSIIVLFLLISEFYCIPI